MSTQAVAPTRTAATPVVTAAPALLLHRMCDCGQHTAGGGRCDECKKRKMMLQRRGGNPAAPEHAPVIVDQVLRSPGQPLGRDVRSIMEPSFGRDFSSVRVHTDEAAAESARAVNALAYTVGNDVVFGSGQYAPETGAGRRLLTHELTHVVQQQGMARSAATAQIGPPDDAYEREANVAAANVGAGRGVQPLTSLSSLRVQRAVGSALLDVLLFIPRLFGLEYFPAEDLKKYLAGLKQRKGPQNSLFSDNMARACVSRERELGPYDTQTKTWLIQEMLGGYTSFLDEGSIITLLRRSPSERPQIVSAIGRDKLWSKFSGENRRIVEALTLTTADAGDALVGRLRQLTRNEIKDYATNVTDPAVRESVRRADALANMTPPAPTAAAITPAGEANFTINGVRVIVQQDQINPSLGNHGFTHSDFHFDGPGEVQVTPQSANQPVGPFAPVDVSVRIWTEFPSEGSKSGSSGYGAGPTLQAHERAHSQGWLTFLQNNPPPAFTGTSTMLPAQFNAAVQQWQAAIRDYGKRAGNFALRAGDCVGNFPTDEQLQGTGFTAAICNQQ